MPADAVVDHPDAVRPVQSREQPPDDLASRSRRRWRNTLPIPATRTASLALVLGYAVGRHIRRIAR